MVIETIQPRFIKHKDAPDFFGVSRGFFDQYIRPSLTEIRWGDSPQSGISYDVLELHALADRIVERNERPAKKGEITWDVKQQESSSLKEKTPRTGMQKVRSSENVLEKALARHRKKKQP